MEMPDVIHATLSTRLCYFIAILITLLIGCAPLETKYLANAN